MLIEKVQNTYQQHLHWFFGHQQAERVVYLWGDFSLSLFFKCCVQSLDCSSSQLCCCHSRFLFRYGWKRTTYLIHSLESVKEEPGWCIISVSLCCSYEQKLPRKSLVQTLHEQPKSQELVQVEIKVRGGRLCHFLDHIVCHNFPSDDPTHS
jgi:hypothetical protein